MTKKWIGGAVLFSLLAFFLTGYLVLTLQPEPVFSKTVPYPSPAAFVRDALGVAALAPVEQKKPAFTPPAGAARESSGVNVSSPVAPTPSPTIESLLAPSSDQVEPAPLVTSALAATRTVKLAAADQNCPCNIEHVVVISIDGLRPDALEQADTPTLDALRRRGAYTPSAQAVLPSVTLVNHASMVSGMSPEKHGITWNVNDPDLGLVRGPTLFSVARQAGLSTTMVVGKPKLEHLVLPGSVDTYIYAGFLDQQVVNEVLPVIEAGLPAILFIHLPDVDSAGHATGWMSPGQLTAIQQTDSMIGEIISSLEAGGYLDQTLLIITSDHGGTGKAHGSASAEDQTIPWLAVGPGVPAGVTLQQQVIVYDTAATVLYAFHLPVPAAWDGRPVSEIFNIR